MDELPNGVNETVVTDAGRLPNETETSGRSINKA